MKNLLQKLFNKQLWLKILSGVFVFAVVISFCVLFLIILLNQSFDLLYQFSSHNQLIIHKDLIEKNAPFVDTNQFLSSAQWVQILIAIISLVVSVFLLQQLRIAKDQLIFDRKIAASEALKRLSENKFGDIRRYLNNDKVVKYFKSIEELNYINYSVSDFNIKFDSVKDGIKNISNEIGSKMRAENVEELLNEYNYIGLLLAHKVIDIDLMTDMAANNAINMYKVVWPYIYFRRKSPNHKDYASHYVDWMEVICQFKK